MCERIAVYGATDATLALLPALARRRDLELAVLFDPSARELRRRLALVEPGAARLLQHALCDDLDVFAHTPGIGILIDGGLQPQLERCLPSLAANPGIAVLSAAAASQQLRLPAAAWREPVAPAPVRTRSSAAPIDGDEALADAIDAAIRAGECFVLLRCVARLPAEPGDAEARPGLARLQAQVHERLRSQLRGGDHLQEAADGSVVALLVDPGPAAALRRLARARAAAEAVAEALRNSSPRPALEFGYALHPEDGSNRTTLLARAAAPRIRMV